MPRWLWFAVALTMSWSAATADAQPVPGPLAAPPPVPRYDPRVAPASHVAPMPAVEPAAHLAPAAAPLPRPQTAPVPLAPPGRAGRDDPSAHRTGLSSLTAVGGSLAMVLGAFFLLVWLFRRGAPKALTALPNEVIEVLGRAPLAGRQQMHLLRLGRKLVLVSVTPAGAETLSEVTDPEEVDRLAGLCQQARPGSATAAFRQMLHAFGTKHAPSESQPAPRGRDSDWEDGDA